MKLIVDTSGVTFTVGREAEARTDQNGVQRQDRNTKLPMWSVQLVAVDATGAEVINVTYVSEEKPKVTVGQPVFPVELQAIPWAQNGKNGTAFRATAFKPVTAAKASA
ncbi:MAG TPA: hypothetical protein VG317_17350 [Pseudonocardiaceae bacterium]|jgi:hypothetical protein|nr:hypothetical protein [Pseudonocardiaceae bacterium]